MKYKIFYLLFLNLIIILFLSGCENEIKSKKVSKYNHKIKTSSPSSFLFWCKRNEISSTNFTIINSNLINYEKLKKSFSLIDGFYSLNIDKDNQKINIVFNNTKSKIMNYKNILIKNKLVIK